MVKLIKTSLMDVCFLVTDGTHDTPKRVNNGFPLIKAKEIVGGQIDFETCDQISEEEHLQVIARSKPEYGDTLFAHIGASLGEAAFVKTNRSFSIKNIALFKPNPEIINRRYLYYLVISPAFQELAKQTKTGSAQPFLSLGYLRSHRIIYHVELIDQRKIAVILSAYDDLIENNLRRIKILEEMVQNLYREWFVKFRFPGHESARFVDSPLGRIPEGWEVVPLSDICHLIMGQSPKSEFYNTNGEGLPFHQGVSHFGDRFPTDRVYCTIENRIAESGDILFSVRAPVGRINMAHRRLVIGRGLSAIRHNYGCRWFVFHFLKEKFKEEDIIGGGTIFKAVTKQDMESIEILSASSKIMKQFEELVEPLERQIDNLTKKSTFLRLTRDLLLPKLISGEMDVSELDIALPEETDE